MKTNHKDKSLAKKVLLSVVAAGVMSGFVLTAEAADIVHEDGQTHTYTSPVEAGKVTADKGSVIELNGGKITGYKHEDGNTLAALVTGNSTLTATDVHFTGDFKAEGGSKVILKGGSVTASDYYEGGKKDLYTEFGAIGENSSIEAEGVDIKSATLATDGAKVTIKDSNINTVEGIWAWENGTIDLISTDGNAKYTVGDVAAEDGGVINIIGGSVEAQGLLASSNASIILNGGGKIIGSKVERHDDQEPEVAFADIAADISDGSILNATNVDFTGGIEASGESKVVLNGGSVTAGSFYDKENKPLYSTEVGADGATIELNQVKIDSNLGAFDGGVITVNDSNVNADAAIVDSGKGAVINLNSTDGSATYTVGEDGIEAEEGAAININGGKVNTSLLVANANTTITVKNADVKATEIIDADGANASITFDGTEKNVYAVDKGIVAENGGKIYIYGGTLKDDNLNSKMYGVKTEEGNTLNTDTKGIVLDKNGVISTMSGQIYKNAASATQKESGAITNAGIDFKGGSLILNDAKFTQSYTDSAQAELKKQGVTKLTMNGELVKEETGEVIPEISVGEAADKFGSNTELDKTTAKADNNLLVGSNDASLAGKDVAGINVKQQVGNGFAVGKLDLKEGNGVVITNNKEVTLGGSQGDSDSIITVNGAVVDVKVVVGTTAPVAGASEINGTLNIGNNNANENTSYKLQGAVEVNAGSSLNVKGQTKITKSLSLNKADVNVNKGLLQTKDLNVKDAANLLGAVNATKLNAAGATLAIGNKDGAGKLTVEKADLNGGMVFLDPAWEVSTGIENASGLAVTDVNAGLNGAYVAGQNSKLSFGANLAAADAAFARSGETWSETGVTAGAYIASTVDVTHGSITVNGSLTAAPAASEAPAGSVKFADNSLLMVNAAKISDTQAAITSVTAAEISAKSKLYLDNAEKDKIYKIIDGVAANWNVDNILSNNKLLTFEVDTATNSVKTTSKSVKDAYGDAVVAGDVYDAAILAGGAAADFVAKAADEHVNANTATQVSAFNSAAAMGELAGVEHGTYAASNLFTDAISEHMSLTNEKEHDSDIWAKYIHSKENVDGLAVAGADSKYDVTYNGIVVGADLYKNGKATVGAALSYVDGSVKGNTLAARTENDATYYGASIYGGIQNEDSAVIGDISYLHGKNDITQHNSGMTLTADAKSYAFSIGVRAEKTLKAGVGKFVPYAGIRYMHLGTGNYNNSLGMSYDGDDMNLWLLPVGVKYSADVKAGGWTIRPIAEIGYVWNMGDRDATQTVSLNGASNGFGYDVADNGSYIGRFVVEAEKANVTYGLGYEYQKGDSVKANKWMANVNWSF